MSLCAADIFPRLEYFSDKQDLDNSDVVRSGYGLTMVFMYSVTNSVFMVSLATQDHYRGMTVSLSRLQYYDNHVSHLQSLFALIQVSSSQQDGLLSLPSWVIGLERAGTYTISHCL